MSILAAYLCNVIALFFLSSVKVYLYSRSHLRNNNNTENKNPLQLEQESS